MRFLTVFVGSNMVLATLALRCLTMLADIMNVSVKFVGFQGAFPSRVSDSTNRGTCWVIIEPSAQRAGNDP